MIDRRQASILADRYLDVLLGDVASMLLLLFQAPLIALLVAGVWKNLASDSLTLYFVLSLSAFFLGAINSAREIVKERALFLREKMFNLSVSAYLWSKLRVQAIFVIVQAAALAGIVRAFVPFQVNVLATGAMLALTALTGTAVGLLISAYVTSGDKAVAAVPLVVIPQILLSDFVIGEDQLRNWTGWLERFMPVRWSYLVLKELRASDPHWSTVMLGPAILCAMIAACFFIALILLRAAEYD